jgi:hypothetical protein
MKAKPTKAIPRAPALVKPRTRAPAPVILRLRQDLKPNEHHPLSGIDPERRNAERVQLIASVLARLANGQSAEADKVGTMTEADDIESSSGEQPTETR